MNIHARPQDPPLDAAEASQLLRRLAEWAERASPEEVAGVDPRLGALLAGGNGAPLAARYPAEFAADDTYRATLPDLQNGPAGTIRGADRRIEHVGISGFRLPLDIALRDGGTRMVEGRVTGTIGLDPGRKGINMSRIIRGFHDQAERPFGFDTLDAAIAGYLGDGSSARLMVELSLPFRVASLRSGLSGWQFYDAAFEAEIAGAATVRRLHLSYVYSSTCPCSLELAEHARTTRGQLATPHSQRSVARLSVRLREGAALYPEDLIDHARRALPTETQVMVKREDEQAFAELNAAHPVFVEDAARLFAEQLQGDARISGFRVVANHRESLHNHDAVAVLSDGPGFADAPLDPGLFGDLSRGV